MADEATMSKSLIECQLQLRRHCRQEGDGRVVLAEAERARRRSAARAITAASRRITAGATLRAACFGWAGRRRVAAEHRMRAFEASLGHHLLAMHRGGRDETLRDEAFLRDALVENRKNASCAAAAHAALFRWDAVHAAQHALEGSEGLVRSALEEMEAKTRQSVLPSSPAGRRGSLGMRGLAAAERAALPLSHDHVAAAVQKEEAAGRQSLFEACARGAARVEGMAARQVHRAAARIQAVYRGHRERCRVRVFAAGREARIQVEEAAEERGLVEAANRVFEAKTVAEQEERVRVHARRRQAQLARRRAEEGAQQQAAAEAQAERDAAAAARRRASIARWAAKDAEEVRKLFAEEQDAAVAIQKGLRGHHARRQVRALLARRVGAVEHARAGKVSAGKVLSAREATARSYDDARLRNRADRAVHLAQRIRDGQELVPSQRLDPFLASPISGSHIPTPLPAMHRGADVDAPAFISIDDLPGGVPKSGREVLSGRRIDAFIAQAKAAEWGRHTRGDRALRAEERLAGHLPAQKMLLARRYGDPLTGHEMQTRRLIEADERFARRGLAAAHQALPRPPPAPRASQVKAAPPAAPAPVVVEEGHDAELALRRRESLLARRRRESAARRQREEESREQAAVAAAEAAARAEVVGARERALEGLRGDHLEGRCCAYEAAEVRGRKERRQHAVENAHHYELLLMEQKEDRERAALLAACDRSYAARVDRRFVAAAGVLGIEEARARAGVANGRDCELAALAAASRCDGNGAALAECVQAEAAARAATAQGLAEEHRHALNDLRVEEQIARDSVLAAQRDGVLLQQARREVRKAARAEATRGHFGIACARNVSVKEAVRPATAGGGWLDGGQALDPLQRVRLREIRTQAKAQQLGAKGDFEALGDDAYGYTMLLSKRTLPPPRKASDQFDESMYNPYHSHLDNLTPPSKPLKPFNYRQDVSILTIDAQEWLKKKSPRAEPSPGPSPPDPRSVSVTDTLLPAI
eukprot:TRINITY_DN3354_c0_g1_i4.p1 TRINITY_DN3354_c0_g1~~TRINITY_DN3354_c0_g1_i4.p1  ORF type:complete len:1105 (+),score=281.00 TRINITY_DN3354_c0_g1_i4:336-3317(+)